MQIEQNVPLAPLTTFGLGGPAAEVCWPETFEDLRRAFDTPLLVAVLGGGSNTLVADTGFPGRVVCTGRLHQYRLGIGPAGDETYVLTAGAGVPSR